MKTLRKTLYFISFPLGFIGFIFPIYASSLGANPIQIGYLFSLFSLVGIIIRPLVGDFIDKRGRKPGILIGLSLYSLVNGIFALASNFKYLLLARTVQAFASSFLWISVDTMVSDKSDASNRGRNFGAIDESISKGGIVGSLIGFTILFNNISDQPFSLIFLIFFATSLISIYYGIKDLPETLIYKEEVKEGIIKDKKSLVCFLTIMGTISLISNMTAPIYLLYLEKNITRNISQISLLFLPASILSTILPRKFGSMSDKYGRQGVVVGGIFLNAILQILIPFSQDYGKFLVLYTLTSLVGMFYGPALSSLVMDFVGEEKRGRAYGRYSLATGLGAAIGPIIGSYIFQNINEDLVFYISGGLLILVSGLIYHIYINNRGRFFRLD